MHWPYVTRLHSYSYMSASESQNWGNFSFLFPQFLQQILKLQIAPRLQAIEQPLRIIFGVGAPARSNLAPSPAQFGDARMTAREANAVLQSAFPAAFEWLLKRRGRARARRFK